MYFVSLRSGSYGNGYLVSDGGLTLMFDAGVPRRMVLEAMEALHIPSPSVIFISHEHHDHIKCLDVILRAFPCVTVIGTAGTIGALFHNDFAPRVLKAWQEISLGDFCVRLVPKPHDAAEPVGFSIEHISNRKIAIMSDLGHPAKEVIEGIRGANLLLIESNYDPKMLRDSGYPEHIKRRINSKYGHLSNRQCGQFIQQCYHARLDTVILGHLSENNNHPDIAHSHSRRLLPMTTRLLVASRYDPLVVRID